jgi:phenylalanyl-tRNA synthetase beta chain
MKISTQELFSLLSIKAGHDTKEIIKTIAKDITNIGFEVDAIEFESDKYENFIVGHVQECAKHPNSQKLSICKVNTGKEILQVLCGAPNVRAGLKVVLATQGAIVPKNGFLIAKTKLAGFESQGMICSASEMGSQLDDGTIIELPSEAQTGTKYAEYIKKNDIILDIAITPNRGDALSYFGIAREIAAKGFGSLPIFETKQTQPHNTLPIILEESLVHSAFFGEFSGVQHVPNVLETLQKCGIQTTKFPIVNFLNYTTELYGQPMHLYDAQKIKGQIIVRFSKSGEKIITISGQEIELQEGDIVVADDEKILSLAGIIGDLRSAITPETQNFVLESCAFSRNYIFQTIRKYNIHTAASFRFERYINSGTSQFSPQLFSAEKFAKEIGVAFSKTFTKVNTTIPNKITFTPSNIKNILGFEVTLQQIVEILQRLGFVCEVKNVEITATVPSWRYFDVSQIYDISEEILRFIGIEHCQIAKLPAQNAQTFSILTKAKNFISRNYDEIISLPFVSKKSFEMFANIENAITIPNPIDIEKPCLRSSILPSLLENISQCEKHSKNSSAIFEISKVFYNKNGKPQEHTEICIVNHGYLPFSNPLHKQEKYTIFHVKESILNILTEVFGLKSNSLVFEQTNHIALHPHQAFNILLGKTIIAQIAQVHPLTLEDYEIKMPVFSGIIHTQSLPPVKNIKKIEYKPQTLPPVYREISILLDSKIECGSILKTIQKIAKQRFNANIIEIFANEEMKALAKHSLLIEIEIYQEKTLNSNEIEELVAEVLSILNTTFNAKLRC